jgi:hypothetical protein
MHATTPRLYAYMINVQYLCKMSDGKIKRPLDIPFVQWISNCPLDFGVSIGSNGPLEFPSDICFFSWSINKYLNEVMTSIYGHHVDTRPLRQPNESVQWIQWIQWTLKCPLEFCLSIGSNGQVEFPSDICFFIWSITMYLNDVMTSIYGHHVDNRPLR